jgi:hypothetical protein
VIVVALVIEDLGHSGVSFVIHGHEPHIRPLSVTDYPR